MIDDENDGFDWPHCMNQVHVRRRHERNWCYANLLSSLSFEDEPSLKDQSLRAMPCSVDCRHIVRNVSCNVYRHTLPLQNL